MSISDDAKSPVTTDHPDRDPQAVSPSRDPTSEGPWANDEALGIQRTTSAAAFRYNAFSMHLPEQELTFPTGAALGECVYGDSPHKTLQEGQACQK